jgi:hypothetical protein
MDTMPMTRPSYAARQRHSPSRQPAWRWQRAQELLAHGRNYSASRDDAPTGRALAYLRARSRCRRDSQLERLADAYADIHAAHQLHQDGGSICVEVQARLLARQSSTDITRLTTVPGPVIEAYEGLFYNVTDKLHAKDWITAQAIGWWRFDPKTGRDAATVLRGFAYHGGPAVLDAIAPYLLRTATPVLDVANHSPDQERLEGSIRRAVAVAMMPWDQKTSWQLMKVHLELCGIAQKVPPKQSQQRMMVKHVTEILENLSVDALQRVPRPARAHTEDRPEPATQQFA